MKYKTLLENFTFMKMKTLFLTTTFSFYLLFCSFHSSAQSVGINETGAAPDNSALLDLSSTNKGFLITRVDTVDIPTPAFGLMTLAPADSCLYMFSGTTWISLGGVGFDCPCSPSTTQPPIEFPCNGTVIPVIDVTNPTTGKTWMDRNLGAQQVANSYNDADAYGDLYQWGRCSDGHEKRNSGVTTTLSPTDTPNHSDFILSTTSPKDWRNTQNNTLWQGISGVNNPCPTGYRIPSEAELNNERLSWSTDDAPGAFASPLKLTVAGARKNDDGSLELEGQFGVYWSSNIVGSEVRNLNYSSFTGSTMSNGIRSYGRSIRCIKDE